MKGGGKWAERLKRRGKGAGDMRFGRVLVLSLTALICSCDASPKESNGQGGAPITHGMVPTDAIVITDTGSTNTLGYRIIVGRSGDASYASGEGHGSAQLPATMFSKLKYDVVMAQPLSHVKASTDCMKPMSFGSSTFVALGDEKTADLTCPASPKGEALKSDVDAVTQFLQVRNVPRGQGHELPPQNY